MLGLLHRRFWLVRGFGVAIASAFAGSAAANALALAIVSTTTSLLPDAADDAAADADDDALDEPMVAPVAGKRAADARTRGREAAATRLLGYNPFCPTCAPVVPAGPELLAQGGPSDAALGHVATRLPLRLSATMEAASPSASLATVYDVERGVVGVFGVGDAIRANVVVTAIESGKVHIRRDGTALEVIELGAPPPEPPKADATKAKDDDAKPKGEEAKPDPALDAISCATERECTIERAFVEEVFANPAAFAKQAPRVVPLPDGGFKLAGVRKNSLASKLGLKNGDVLLAVNGESLTGLDDALGMATKLRRASNLSVTLERKGATIEKHVEIR